MEKIDRYFEGIAWKYLSAVDAEPSRSNQHELGGLVQAGFAPFLGEPGTQTFHFPARYILLMEEQDESTVDTGRASWYDSRRHNSRRSRELRLYYDSNPVTEKLVAGMFLLVAKQQNGELLLVFAQRDSSAEKQLRWLFGISDSGEQFEARSVQQGHEKLSWAAAWVLEEIGIEVEVRDDRDSLEKIIRRFGESFPTTRKFSAFARESIKHLEVVGNPDDALMTLTETEERLFRILERHIVQKRLDKGFDGVDEFISYSLSVHNTRKSRAGHSLENHLEFVFKEHDIRFERGAYTELRSKPDFLFPGAAEYHDPSYDAVLLSMLGVKTTCKDRWRQVLRESQRIPAKHLATLEPGISSHQTSEMKNSGLQLVVPKPLHETFSDQQRDWLWSIEDFLNYRKSIQG